MTDFPQRNDERIEWLKEHGTSLTIDWGEDDNLWSVAWITGGARYTHASIDLGRALYQVYRLALEAARRGE